MNPVEKFDVGDRSLCVLGNDIDHILSELFEHRPILLIGGNPAANTSIA